MKINVSDAGQSLTITKKNKVLMFQEIYKILWLFYLRSTICNDSRIEPNINKILKKLNNT